MISIIVPVYNAEKYIHRCVDSLLAQTYRDFEILLVDDGSPDNSGTICDEYAQKDNRVRVIHKKNGGVSSARQCGIDHALGEYTIHADPDDWVEPTMLEELYRKAVETDSDMVICDFYMNDGKQQIYKTQRPTSLESNLVLKELFQHLHGSCCNKLVRRSCYSKYNVSFPTRFNLYEDLCVNTKLLTNPIKVAYLNKAFYHYDIGINNSSMVKRIDINTIKADEFFVEEMKNILKEYPQLSERFLRNISYSIVLRGFKSKLFTSRSFVKQYNKYKKYIFSGNEGHVVGKILCYLSCLGFYGILKFAH